MEVLKSSDTEISDEVFALFSELIYKTSGIRLASVKKGFLLSRLLKRLKKLDIPGFYSYYQRVAKDYEERVEMLNCISTNTTMFFREEYHFEYLKNSVLPELLGENACEAIRIWSAGCSTGEEPYSIAIAAHEALRHYPEAGEQGNGSTFHDVPCARSFKDLSDRDIKILATDISTEALEMARGGVYEQQQIPDGIQPDLVRRYFLKGVDDNRGKIKVKDFIKHAVTFKRLNLKDMIFPFQKKFDIIFCRNVMIYFDGRMKEHVLSLFYRHLNDKGYLFLGHAETMLGKDTFKPVFITAYKKLDG